MAIRFLSISPLWAVHPRVQPSYERENFSIPVVLFEYDLCRVGGRHKIGRTTPGQKKSIESNCQVGFWVAQLGIQIEPDDLWNLVADSRGRELSLI